MIRCLWHEKKNTTAIAASQRGILNPNARRASPLSKIAVSICKFDAAFHDGKIQHISFISLPRKTPYCSAIRAFCAKCRGNWRRVHHDALSLARKKRARQSACSFFFVAEREGFEPSVRDYRTHDFQSCALDQLSHLSRSPVYHTTTSPFCQALFFFFQTFFQKKYQPFKKIRTDAKLQGCARRVRSC